IQSMQKPESFESLQQVQQPDTPTDMADSSREKGKEQKMRGEKRTIVDGEERGEVDKKGENQNNGEQKRKRVDGDEATDDPLIFDTQKVDNENVIEIDQPNDDPDNSRWDTLRWKARPAFERIASLLRSDGDCADLRNLSMVSTYFRPEVINFMKRANNRPDIRRVYLEKDNYGKLAVVIYFFPSNSVFHDLSDLDWIRFERSWGWGSSPRLYVALSGPDNPIIEKVVDLLSGRVMKVKIDDYGVFSSSDLSLSAELLQNSTIDFLIIVRKIIDNSTVCSIFDLISRSKELDLHLLQEQKFMDKAGFIKQLASMDLT
ncbi:hypothetical protein PMAYCL1PPCAC_27451, partial [Pristionchus mayeri]